MKDHIKFMIKIYCIQKKKIIIKKKLSNCIDKKNKLMQHQQINF